ncbi:kinase-like protein [Macrolepiota fuliginosa MF-IS2]|uniref:Kinase-like protein n=1 Tax=Macrolepiota fuliginosa MF-IS2 TaxID=1400762 RepID=A0A9P5XAG1_9AGAR|nr:kinase-like protein [Macrolepiota fuliginosa MF-IS2]
MTEAVQQLHGIFETPIEKQDNLLNRTKSELRKAPGIPGVPVTPLSELGELRKERDKAIKDMQQLNSSLFGKWTFVLGFIRSQYSPSTFSGLLSVADEPELGLIRQQPEIKPFSGIQSSQLKTLVLNVIGDEGRRTALVTKLQGTDEARSITDAINDILHETPDILQGDKGKQVLWLLYKLTKSTNVFPQYYRLKGVQVNPRAVAGGAYSDVHRGWYKGKEVCVKAVRTFQEGNTERLTAYAAELIMWPHLSHINILPFYGVYMDQKLKRPCLISPWIENSHICDYLRKDHPQDFRMLLVSDIIDGLCYLHELGIVHCDLKGQNILISNDKRALIADFGISHVAMGTGGLTASFRGTINWSAPELFTVNDGEVFNDETYVRPTTASDIWSFGCVCYEVFTHKIPFYQVRGGSLVATLMKGIAIPLRPPSDSPDHIEDVMWDLMKKCWNYKSQDRPTCKQLQSFFKGLNLQDNRPRTPVGSEDGHAFWRAMKAESKEEVDYQRAFEILTRIWPSTRSNSTGPSVPLL